MSAVIVDYNTFMNLMDVKQHIKDFESEGNHECVKKLQKSFIFYLTRCK